MNILPAIERPWRAWPIVACAHCGDDLNANDNFGSWDMRQHFAECQLFLSSEVGHHWRASDEGRLWIQRAIPLPPPPETT